MSTAASPARNDYIGDGSTDAYAITFAFGNGDLLEVKTRTTSGDETVLALTTDYTLTATYNALQVASGGTITLTAGNLASGVALAIRRAEAIDQPTSLTNNGANFPTTAMAMVDRVTRNQQQQQEELGRSLHLPVSEAGTVAKTELPYDRASKFLAFSADKEPIASEGIPDVPATAFAATLLDDANLAEAQATLGISTFAATLVDDADEAAARATLGGLVPVVATIAALKALTGTNLTGYVQVAGYTTAGDGGGGLFRWVAADATADDGGTVIAPTVGNGRFFRVISSAQIDPVWFGADTTGSGDSTAAWVSAVAYAVTSGKAIKPSTGDYVVSVVNIPSGVHIYLDEQTRILKTAGTLSDDNNAFRAVGTVTATSSACSSNVAKGSSTVAVTDGSLFTAGDWCLLRDNTWASASVAGRNQELVQVESVAVNTVTITKRALGPYATADTAELVLVTPVSNIGIHGGTIVVPTGTNTGGGIQLELVVQSQVSRVRVSGPNDNPAIGLGRCSEVDISHCTSCDGQSLTSGGYAYGISIGESSSYICVDGCNSYRIRENPISNRARAITVSGGMCIAHQDTGWNTHGSWCDGVSISDILAVACNVGVSVGFSSHTKQDYNITVRGCMVIAAKSHGISVAAPVGKENVNITIHDNDIFGCGISASSSGIYVSNITQGVISSNRIDGQQSSNVANGVLLSAAVDLDVRDNSVKGLTNGYGFTISNCLTCVVAENSVRDVSSHSYRTTGTNTGTQVNFNHSDDGSVSLSSIVTRGNSWQDPAQAGYVDVTIAAASSATQAVAFPRAFAATPMIVATAKDTVGNFCVTVSGESTTGCTVRITDVAAASRTGSVRVWWQAAPAG